MATNMAWQAVLGGTQLIEKLAANKSNYAKATESKKILVIREDNLFVWHPADQCLLTVKLKTSEYVENGQCIVQTLMLTNPPLFEVDALLLNHTGYLLAIYGLKGITVLEIPRSWGKQDRYEGGKPTILCRSWNLAERLLLCNNRMSVVQAAWHPGSISATHLIFLASDNYLRIYDVTEPDGPKQVISLNQYQQSYYLSSSSRISFASSLGETAVSFDFGPPVPVVLNISETVPPGQQDKDLVWPLYVLKGNGDVYLINTSLTRRYRSQKIVGPLTMHPPTEDNYGVDACSILCIHSSLPVLVIATCSGIIYHCIVLSHSSSSSDDETESATTAEEQVNVYVYESIELALSLAPSEIADELFSCPIKLYKDPTSIMRYHCAHSGGVHVVTLPLVKFLDQYALEERDVDVHSIINGQDCVVEHLLCTRPLPSEDAAPILGLAVAPTHFGLLLLALLSSWELVDLRWIPTLPSHDLLSEKTSDEKALCKPPDDKFEKYIQQQLQHTNTAPILKSLHSSSTEPSPQQLLQLLCYATHLLREEYLEKFERVRIIIECRVKTLQDQKVQQLQELQHFLIEKKNLTEMAEKLAERYEDAEAFQHEIVLRIENVLKTLQRRLPVLSEAEISMKNELQALKEKLKHFETAIEQINVKRKYQETILKELLDSGDSWFQTDAMSGSLSDTQQKLLKEMLSKQGNAIGCLVKQLSALKEEVGF